MGRPKGSKNKSKYPENVKYREEWVQEWLLGIAGGKTMHELYDSNKDKFPAPITVGKWLSQHDDFYERFMKAKRIGAEIDADHIRYIADSCDNSSSGAVQKARLQVDTRMKIISKLLPGTYGERVQVDQNIDDKRELDHGAIKKTVADVGRKYLEKEDDKLEMVQ